MSMRITPVRAFAANHERQIIAALVIHEHYEAQVGLSAYTHRYDAARIDCARRPGPAARILAPEDEDEDAGSGT